MDADVVYYGEGWIKMDVVLGGFLSVRVPVIIEDIWLRGKVRCAASSLTFDLEPTNSLE
jgi:hypothetical protein